MILMIVPAAFIAVVWALWTAVVRKDAEAAYGAQLTEQKLCRLMTLPAFLLKRCRYMAKTGYDKKIKVQVVEYFGRADAEQRFLLHQAEKITFVLLAAVFCCLIGAGTTVDGGYAFFCVLMLGAAFILPDSRLDREVKKRKLEIMLDFPDFIVKLTLLVNAGMRVGGAWDKAAGDTDKTRALGRELEVVKLEIKSGKSEAKAYEDFAKRCRMPEVTRVVAVLLQNVKKGNAELVSILRLQAGECWELRKAAAKKLGEEASSKMLLPMAIMLLSILLIVTTPAILALQGI